MRLRDPPYPTRAWMSQVLGICPNCHGSYRVVPVFSFYYLHLPLSQGELDTEAFIACEPDLLVMFTLFLGLTPAHADLPPGHLSTPGMFPSLNCLPLGPFSGPTHPCSTPRSPALHGSEFLRGLNSGLSRWETLAQGHLDPDRIREEKFLSVCDCGYRGAHCI